MKYAPNNAWNIRDTQIQEGGRGHGEVTADGEMPGDLSANRSSEMQIKHMKTTHIQDRTSAALVQLQIISVKPFGGIP